MSRVYAPIPLLALLLLAGAHSLAAQRPAERDTVVTARRIGPGGAFLRSLLVPGWGQASLGAYTRGGVYFATQGASWFMLLKTLGRLSEARDIEVRLEGAARDSLLSLAATDTALARKLNDPDTLAARIGEAGSVRALRRLIRAREEQREDWITWTAFWTLASAVDAYVGAHLADFPAQVGVVRRGDGSVAVAVRVRRREP